MSRIAHRAFFFDEEEKNRFAELLMRVEYFSGVIGATEDRDSQAGRRHFKGWEYPL